MPPACLFFRRAIEGDLFFTAAMFARP